ncbi:PRTRC system protein B [Inquilinus sp. KBS0705]|nr:PRTRC system protein B [Inquilinus sp. KBS0705]
MKNITEQFNIGLAPVKALLIYGQQRTEAMQRQEDIQPEIYVESYDIGRNGQPVNAHPLSVKEMIALSEVLQSAQDVKGGFLKSRGLLPQKVLYVDQQVNGFAVWHTPPREVTLFFTDALGIPSGNAKIPALVWKADGSKLSVYAVKGKARPCESTTLCHAPFFNIYANGNVCMGTVSIQIACTSCLEDFMQEWEQYFFSSYFSHSINGNSSTKTDTKLLWEKLRKTGCEFPQAELIKTRSTLKQLIG